jgi:hypothetical protein
MTYQPSGKPLSMSHSEWTHLAASEAAERERLPKVTNQLCMRTQDWWVPRVCVQS